MALERDLELLDDYLGNRLKGSDRVAFEDKLKADPELQQALHVQQQVIEGLRKARIVELKTMLNAVPVPPVGAGMTGLTKFTIGAFSTVVVGTLLYIGLSKKESVVQAPSEPPPAVYENKIEPVISPEQLDAPVSVEEDKQSSTTKKEKVISKENKATQKTSDKPVINAFTPAEEQQEVTSANEMEAPATSGITRVSTKPSIVAEINTNNKKYNFHYVLINNKLTLYGNFENNIYEIIEVFNNEKRSAFLFYKNNYYLLSDTDVKVKQLIPINDPALLNKLKEYRTQ